MEEVLFIHISLSDKLTFKFNMKTACFKKYDFDCYKIFYEHVKGYLTES